MQRALAIVLLAFAFTHGAYQVGRAAVHSKQGLDFTPEWIAARMLVDHGDRRFYAYEVVKDYGRRYGLHGPLGPDDPVINYAYPPWLPVAYAPVSRLPWTAARLIWMTLSFAAVFGAAALAGAAVAPRPGDRRSYALGAVGAACFFFPIPYGLMAGQANDLILLGIVGALWFLRTDRPFLAGLVLAPAAMWKIFTGFPALFLLARREWRALGGLAAGCAALILTSLPFVGVQTWIDWARYMQQHNVVTSYDFRNHSIAAATIVLALPTWTKHALALAAIIALTATLFPDRRRADPRYAVQFAATLALAVLLTPKAWEHYGVYLLPLFVACYAALAEPSRPAALAVLAACFAVWGLTLQLKEEYVALASGGALKRALLPLKCYATLALLALSLWTAKFGSMGAQEETGRGRTVE